MALMSPWSLALNCSCMHATAADTGDKEAAEKGWAGLKNRANAFVRLANQHMPAESTPLSEIK